MATGSTNLQTAPQLRAFSTARDAKGAIANLNLNTLILTGNPVKLFAVIAVKSFQWKMSMDNNRAFLNHLFSRTSGYFEVTFIHPTIKDRNVRTLSHKLGTDKPQWDKIAAMNNDGWGVYYGATTNKRRCEEWQRRKKSDVKMLSCLWAEIDYHDGVYADLAAIHTRLADFRIPPTAMLSSGGGVHLLWRVTPIMVTAANRPGIEETLRGIAVTLRGDTAVAEVARVLRMPGTVNTKPERNGARCELIDLIDGEYKLADFAAYRAVAKPVARPLERSLPRHKPDSLPKTANDYLSASTVTHRNNALNNAAFSLHSNGYSHADGERLLLGKALSDGLSEREAQRTIQSAFNAAPGTPSYISYRNKKRMEAGDAVQRKISEVTK